jgi:hypothetical protein
MTIYKLESENLTGLGGPMGTEHTWINWTRYFDSMQKAKQAAEKDYASYKNNKFSWHRAKNYVHSDDLLFVMYKISKFTVE